MRRILQSRSPHVLYVDHSHDNGRALYQLAYQLDLEDIVTKRADSRYEDDLKVLSSVKLESGLEAKGRKRGLVQASGYGFLYRRFPFRGFSKQMAAVSPRTTSLVSASAPCIFS
jgi:hypothetical protein